MALTHVRLFLATIKHKCRLCAGHNPNSRVRAYIVFLPGPPTTMLYHVGLSVFASWVFNTTTIEWTKCTSIESDIIVYGIWLSSPCDISTFKGTVVAINGEDHTRDLSARGRTSKWIVVGVGGVPIPYGMVEWIQGRMGIPSPNHIPKHFAVAYINTNCVPQREQMVKEISKSIPVHAYGNCYGQSKHVKRFRKASGTWHTNGVIYKNYAFAIAAEHGISHNYVTEKPFITAAAGAIPIYSGSDLIREFLNTDRILFWDNYTVSRLTTLSQNRHEYFKLANLPILKEHALLKTKELILSRIPGHAE